ncbi:hypothetical protein PhCBS80983_g00565 [Powellomyces hirtus]|uniref:Uncharacterized protein n=1 Tax=Powellomyces hirtus TaxID=109895 RepID=A0A507EEW2_9FUNG|nr:hypothetical protein PhCBS80983_g00565 [Powellomyces hirtus]
MTVQHHNSAASLYRTGLEHTAKRLFPSYRNLADAASANGDHGRRTADDHSSEILSNLYLQILLFCNVWFMLPVWAIGMTITAVWKASHDTYSTSSKLGTIVLVPTFALIECSRLYLGYKGNLHEKVPEVAGHLLLTVFPQLFIVFYLAAAGQATGFETAINILYVLLFLLPQIVAAVIAARGLVRAQSARFFLTAHEVAQ